LQVAYDFNIPEMVQATFYVTLLNDAEGLSLVSRDMAKGLKETLEGLRWTSFESWLDVNRCGLLQLRQQTPPGVFIAQ